MGRRYGKLPSELLDIDIRDLQIDWLCCEMGIKAENDANKKAQKKAGKG